MMFSESTTTRTSGGMGSRPKAGKTKAPQCFKRCGCSRVHSTRFVNNPSRTDGQSGFTLVEIIVTLVAAGLLAVFYFHFMGTAMDFSWKSVELVAGEAEAEGKMEEIIAYYTSKINSDPDNALADVVSQFTGDATMVYISYDSGGNESTLTIGTSNNLKVIVEAPGNDFTTILTKSRTDGDNPIVYY